MCLGACKLKKEGKVKTKNEKIVETDIEIWCFI